MVTKPQITFIAVILFMTSTGFVLNARANTQNVPYRLSKSELSTLQSSKSPGDDLDTLFDSNDIMRRAWDRLLANIIASKSAEAEYQKAISGPGPNVEIASDRFIFGSRCTKHACTYAEGGFIADLQSGDIVFATNIHDGILTIYEKECVNNDLEKFALTRLQQSWNDTGDGYIDPPHMDANTKILKSKCQ